MKKYAVVLFALFISMGIQAQTTGADAVKKTITRLFEGMRKGDSTIVKSTLAQNVIFQTVATSKGNTKVQTENVQNFLKAVGSKHTEMWDERITFHEVLVDDGLASVWTSYRFYAGDKFSHCGVNSFQLAKENDKWEIIYLIDTRRKDKCPE